MASSEHPTIVEWLSDKLRNKVDNITINSIFKSIKNRTDYLILLVCISIILFSKYIVIYITMFMCDQNMVSFTGHVDNIDDILLALGHQWDSVHFVNIASNWYPSGVFNDASYAFAPLYPYLISVFENFNGDYYMSGILISNTAYFMSLVAFYFVSRQYMNRPYSYLSTTMFAVFPTYLVYGTVAYTEPVALFFAITSWYLFKNERYLSSSIFITFAIFTRYIFIMIVPIYGLIMLTRTIRRFRRHDKKIKLIEWNILWLLIPTISVIILFKYFESLTGNFFVVFDSHIFFADALRSPIAQFDWFFTGFFTQINNLNPVSMLLERYIFTIPLLVMTFLLLRGKKELFLYGITMMIWTLSMIGISGVASPRIALASWTSSLGPCDRIPYSMYIVIIVLFMISGLWVMFHFLTGFFA